MRKVMLHLREGLRTLGGKLTPEYLFDHTKLTIGLCLGSPFGWSTTEHSRVFKND